MKHKQTKSMLFIMLALFAMIFILIGCGQSDEQTTAEEPEAENQEGTQEAENQEQEENNEASQEVVEVSHAMGTTTIEEKPERIVTLYQGATDAAVAFGITPVGVVESWREQPMYKYLRDDLTDVPIVGQETQPNLEEINKLNPDLIIASKLRHEEIYDQLSAIAPTVTHETVFAFKETVELMGEAMMEEEKADELLTAWDDRVAKFQEQAEATYADDWPYHVSVLNFRADHARIYVTGFAGSILDELGFEGPKEITDDSQAVLKLTDKESITEMNADVFYLFMDDEEAVQKTYQEWTEHPLWKELDAVEADQVHRVDEVIWNMGGGIIAANLMLDDIFDRLELEE
ncbi:iron-siderophore ABC transporter substrate-binding protein [Gracilibacillus sp. YIM 98692]|uniref:ABC transporter substrate-binding protein n=1 Tax=Gracilibacillus sp. YIM 98692 TaxID=2663532 RepID=UPI001F09133F|nr:iron-siderophore ABC transporter substrate-binding protein [Gracilibacillus sp. YIM 98692]